MIAGIFDRFKSGKKPSESEVAGALLAEAEATIAKKLAPLATSTGRAAGSDETDSQKHSWSSAIDPQERRRNRLREEPKMTVSKAERLRAASRLKPKNEVRNRQLNVKISADEYDRLRRLQAVFKCSLPDLLEIALEALEEKSGGGAT